MPALTAPQIGGFVALTLRGDGADPVDAVDAQALAKALQDPGRRGLVICLPPLEAVAGALRQGYEPAVALAEWCAQARPWLRARSRHRARITLVERPRDAGQRAALAALLHPLPAPEAQGPEGDEATRALAALALALDPEAQALAQELQAATRGAGAEPLDPPAALRVLADAVRAHAAQVTALRDDLVGARAERDGLQEAIVELTGSEAELAYTLSILRAQMAADDAEPPPAEAARAAPPPADLAPDRDALEAAVAALRLEAEASRKAGEAAQAELAALASQHLELREALRRAEARRITLVAERRLLDRSYRLRLQRIAARPGDEP